MFLNRNKTVIKRWHEVMITDIHNAKYSYPKSGRKMNGKTKFYILIERIRINLLVVRSCTKP